jgi:hypothetical protein
VRKSKDLKFTGKSTLISVCDNFQMKKIEKRASGNLDHLESAQSKEHTN